MLPFTVRMLVSQPDSLLKAGLLYCRKAGVERIVIAGGAPIDRQYDALQFEEVYPGVWVISRCDTPVACPTAS